MEWISIPRNFLRVYSLQLLFHQRTRDQEDCKEQPQFQVPWNQISHFRKQRHYGASNNVVEWFINRTWKEIDFWRVKLLSLKKAYNLQKSLLFLTVHHSRINNSCTRTTRKFFEEATRGSQSINFLLLPRRGSHNPFLFSHVIKLKYFIYT